MLGELVCRRLNDLRPAEQQRWQRLVELVVADFPTAANDSARGIVEPLAFPANLDLLPARQPESPADEPILEHERQVFERFIEEGRAREREIHSHDLTARLIDVHRADDAWQRVGLGTYAHFVHVNALRPGTDRKAVREREVVYSQPNG